MGVKIGFSTSNLIFKKLNLEKKLEIKCINLSFIKIEILFLF